MREPLGARVGTPRSRTAPAAVSRALTPIGMRSQPDTRNNALDGLRAIAALGVLTFHSWLYRTGRPPGPRTSLTDHLLFQGNLGLICFFVLSGFLLYRVFARAALTGDRLDLGAYARRRVARILP